MLKRSKNGQKLESTGRTVGRTEHSWCKAVSGGTGITVLAFQVSKTVEISLLRKALHQLQNVHPILRSKLHYNTSRNVFSFITPATPNVQTKTFDLSSTSELIQSLSKRCNSSELSPLHIIHEHEMNNNVWFDPSGFPEEGMDMFFSSLYELPGPKWIIALRLHTAVCDRTTAVSLLRELMELAGKTEEGGGGGDSSENGVKNEKVCLGVDDLIPSGKTKKTLWAHGMDMLGYSLNSFRLTNLKFKDVKWPRRSEFVRLQMNSKDTNQLLADCKSRGIKLSGVLAAAGLIAARSSKCNTECEKKYAVVTLTDCRTILDPPLTAHDFGFYHSAIVNIHAIKGAENLWELATRSYVAMANSKKCNKHFSDMADINFLMCKAIENSRLTASSSLRTSLISVFEDPVFDSSNQIQQELGLEDYIGCASVHGVGPSIAVFDTIRDGQLDCECVYPSPLHSREQMLEFVDKMKRVLIDAIN